MSELNLLEEFDQYLNWLFPPAEWTLENGQLTIFPDAKTDYWQRTHYGFQNDNGHFLYAELEGDFVLTTKTRFSPQHQYDQAGLMVRFTPDFWLKTSIEFEPDEPNRLGSVVTRYGYSDWATQDIGKGVVQYQLRIRCEGDDYIVDYRETDQTPWSQIRMAHLENLDKQPVLCGLYACSPIDTGFRAEFEFLNIEQPV